MKQYSECCEFRWAAKLPEDGSQCFSIDRVECFGKFDKDRVETHILLSAFLLDLSDCEDHVSCTAVKAKSTLGLEEILLSNSWNQSVQHNASKAFPGYGE